MLTYLKNIWNGNIWWNGRHLKPIIVDCCEIVELPRIFKFKFKILHEEYSPYPKEHTEIVKWIEDNFSKKGVILTTVYQRDGYYLSGLYIEEYIEIQIEDEQDAIMFKLRFL